MYTQYPGLRGSPSAESLYNFLNVTQAILLNRRRESLINLTSPMDDYGGQTVTKGGMLDRENAGTCQATHFALRHHWAFLMLQAPLQTMGQ